MVGNCHDAIGSGWARESCVARIKAMCIWATSLCYFLVPSGSAQARLSITHFHSGCSHPRAIYMYGLEFSRKKHSGLFKNHSFWAKKLNLCGCLLRSWVLEFSVCFAPGQNCLSLAQRGYWLCWKGGSWWLKCCRSSPGCFLLLSLWATENKL